ncbi:hypothetical protein SIL82_05520 [Sphingomonas echinoides]|uniref:Lipoprotein n=2 Tax=Sphingomonas echinoides TaxID=59803 RepID=A0ABU4PHQ3_9SPHN|nr:hypothetical protein [Sphingomonas echinoides]MDX5983713.1 hypothetical protein [Sphingomonas echinoides]
MNIIYRRTVAAALIMALASCAPIELVSKYDEQTDNIASAMQKDVDTFFVKIDTSIVPSEAAFGNYKGFYEKSAVDIQTLTTRVGAIPGNGITMQQVETVRENLAILALLHKGCVSKIPTGDQLMKIRTKGIDASIACRKDFGADNDLPDQSKHILLSGVADVAHGLIDQCLNAIIVFEIGKKRGQTAKAK